MCVCGGGSMFCVSIKPAIKKGAKRRAVIASILHPTRRKQRKAIDVLQLSPSPFPPSLPPFPPSLPPKRVLFARPRGVTRKSPIFTQSNSSFYWSLTRLLLMRRPNKPTRLHEEHIHEVSLMNTSET